MNYKGEISRALGLEVDASAYGMGKVSKRFALIVDDGKIVYKGVELPGKLEASNAEAILSHL
jgi:peroxiredoxin